MFFQSCTTPQEVKSKYRQLAKKHHPDMGGNAETFKRVNRVYQETLKKLDGTSHKGNDGKFRRYTYNEETEAEIMRIVGLLLALKTGNDLEIIIIGTWVWVGGNTYPHKKAIKSVGKMRWHGKRKKWYWKPKGHYASHNGKFKKFSELKAIYGAKTIEAEDDEERLLSEAKS